MDRPMTGMGVCANEPVRQKSVPASLSVLEKSLGEHHDLLMQLSTILQGALSPERPRSEPEPKKQFANCPVAEVVMRNVGGVEECSYIVRSLLERLEV